MMEFLFIVLFLGGMIGVILAGVTGSDSKVLWAVSILCMALSGILIISHLSTPDIYVIKEDKNFDYKSIYWKSTYTMKDGTVIDLSKDSTYIINEDGIPLEQETVGYCEDLQKVGTPIPDYSLDTLTKTVLKYNKSEVYVFCLPGNYLEIPDTRKIKEVRKLRIGIAGQDPHSENTYRRLIESVPEYNYNN